MPSRTSVSLRAINVVPRGWSSTRPVSFALLERPDFTSFSSHTSVPSRRNFFSSLTRCSHSNPLGLPTSGSKAPPSMPRAGVVRKTRIPGVNHVVVVASGKGGVGKSTVSSNLALALLQARPTRRVGLLDLDVFGPSVPKLMGLEGLGEPALSQQNKLVPMENHGIGTMSMGYLVPQSPTGENPIVWRGIMVMKAVQQLLFDVDWTSTAGSTTSPSTSASKGDNLDVLVIDMPPGTGDVALSLGQLVIVDTAVVVSTPQEIALIDMRKGVGLFRKLGIPIHGLVLNMAHLPSATSMPKIFPFGSAEAFERAARELGVAEVGRLPLVEAISSGGDEGKPVVLRGKGEKGDAGEEVREVFGKMAEGVWRELET